MNDEMYGFIIRSKFQEDLSIHSIVFNVNLYHLKGLSKNLVGKF